MTWGALARALVLFFAVATSPVWLPAAVTLGVVMARRFRQQLDKEDEWRSGL